MGSFGTVIIIVIITSHVRGDHMRPITPIPSPLPTYAFACSSLNDLRLIDGEYANHFPVFVPMLYPIAKLLSKVYCASKWLSYKNLTGSVCGLP